jgi:predicted nucleic acid-binding protein
LKLKCLDTDLLVAILSGEHAAERIGLDLATEAKNATTTVNAFELFHGVRVSQKRLENVGAVKALLQKLEVLHYRLLKEPANCLLILFQAASLSIIGNAMIAGIVATLVTRNQKHFERIPNLKLEEW